MTAAAADGADGAADGANGRLCTFLRDAIGKPSNIWRSDDKQTSPIRCNGNISHSEFFYRYLLPNKPALLSNVATSSWPARHDWLTSDGCIDIKRLRNLFASSNNVTVPVADCAVPRYNDQSREEMTLSDYLDYLEKHHEQTHGGGIDDDDSNGDDDRHHRLLYLKDWHFTRAFPSYDAYTIPSCFRDDILNPYWDSGTATANGLVSDDSCNDDYRFVYIGPGKTWTPLHTDVYRSYSFSANIVGRKRWLLFPPSVEACLTDATGRVIYNVLEDIDLKRFPRWLEAESACVDIIQEPGEIIFVPSDWHHQVVNLTDCISINHNWATPCNIDCLHRLVDHDYQSVLLEMLDGYSSTACHELVSCRPIVTFQDPVGDQVDLEFERQCQLVLRTNTGFDFRSFFLFLNFVVNCQFAVLNRCQFPTDSSFTLETAELEVLLAVHALSRVWNILTVGTGSNFVNNYGGNMKDVQVTSSHNAKPLLANSMLRNAILTGELDGTWISTLCKYLRDFGAICSPIKNMMSSIDSSDLPSLIKV